MRRQIQRLTIEQLREQIAACQAEQGQLLISAPGAPPETATASRLRLMSLDGKIQSLKTALNALLAAQDGG